MNINYIIVPDGVSVNQKGEPLSKPSFVFRQVLDFALTIADERDVIFLAPANDFGSGRSEHEIASDYLLRINPKLCIRYPGINLNEYIDTRGNAIYLKQFIADELKNKAFQLICSNIHSFRAEYCFRKIGFNIAKVHRVKYKINKEENIVKRLWYYKYRPLHIIYELLASGRDFMRFFFLSLRAKTQPPDELWR